MPTGHDGRVGTPAITTEMVRSLVAEQFPSWAHLDVRPVDVDGWDNRSFRLGDDLLVRIPSADADADADAGGRRAGWSRSPAEVVDLLVAGA